MFNKTEIKEICALTPMQRGMLHHALLEPGRASHHEQLVLRLEGELDPLRLEAAWQHVVDCHDALRGRFLSERVSSPVHVIPHREKVTLLLRPIHDPTSTVAPDGLPAELEAALACDLGQCFNLEDEHPMRLTLYSSDKNLHWLLWSVHHILLDGWSMGIVLEQVLAHYNGFNTVPPSSGYSQYQRWLAGRDKSAALQYWRHYLSGFSGEALLSSAVEHMSDQAPTTSITAHLDAATTDKLRAMASTQRTSLHHVLLCGWGLTVGCFTDQRDVLIPTVLAGRSAELDDAENLVGLFINNVPMRISWQSQDTFATLLQAVREHNTQASTHQNVSLAEIQAVTGPLPIDHVFLMQGLPHQDFVGKNCGAARITGVSFRENIPYTLKVSLTPHEAGVDITLRGEHDLVWLQTLADALCALLVTVAAHPQQRLDTLEWMTPEQRARLFAWGDGGAAPAHGTILQAFDAQLESMPDALALVCDTRSLTYRELHQCANQLAHTLLAAGPLPPDTPVALVSHRDPHLLIGLIAILRAGAAYVPVDPDFPAERVRLMLEASGCRHILASSDLAASLPVLPGVRILHLDAADPCAPTTPPQCTVEPDHLAYIIFTSGSTGIPKGALLRHRNAASLFACMPTALGFGAGDRMLAVTTVSFDMAVLEIVGAFTWGMAVVLASATQARDPALLLELIQREHVTVMQMTPTRLRLLLDAAETNTASPPLAGVRMLLVGGEALPQTLAEQLLTFEHLKVFNVYGPTETAVWSSYWPLAAGPIGIGRAFPGERLLVLSSQHRLQPPGALGEIAIAGVGVARGYLNDPVRTAERFITLPDIEGSIYLTGDLARWHSDGSLRFHGRRDGQTKVRGMRIELGEIEHHLRQIPGVRDAAAAIRKSRAGEAEIVGYLVPQRGEINFDPAILRTTLATSLPAAMVPTHFMLLDALPQTPNGKTDRRALPEPEPLADNAGKRIPANELEAAITHVFGEVLGHSVGPDDDFFLSGGHSLLAIQTVGRLNRALSSAYTLRDLYCATTPAALARMPVRYTAPISQAPQADDYVLSYQQKALWVLDQIQPGYAGYNVPGAYLLSGTLNVAALKQAWAALIARHASLRTVFRTVNGMPRQQVLDHIEFDIECHMPCVGADIKTLVGEITCRPFNLAHGPLFRIARIPLDAERQLLLLVMHHIINDGWSDALLANDLVIAYRAALAGEDPLAALPAAPAIAYHDFAVWQERYLASPLAQTHSDYWQARLHKLPQLTLPTQGVRHTTLNRPGSRVDMRIEDSAAWLATVPAHERYATIVIATLALLHLESGQTDLVLGLPVANRNRPELQDQVGLHVNSLPLRQQLSVDTPLEELRRHCASAIVEAMAHADYPFARLVDELCLSAEPGRHPVFDAMLIFHQHPVPVPQLEGLKLAPYDPQSYTSRFDLDFEVWAGDDGVHGFIEYDTNLFTAEQASGFAARWQEVLVTCAREPTMTLRELRKITATGQEESARFLANSLALDEEF